jgi:lysophospholipase L1-like esterase
MAHRSSRCPTPPVALFVAAFAVGEALAGAGCSSAVPPAASPANPSAAPSSSPEVEAAGSGGADVPTDDSDRGAVAPADGEGEEQGEDGADVDGIGGGRSGGGHGLAGEGEGEGAGDAEPSAFAACFAAIGSATGVAPDYDQFRPVVGSHCAGTDHQDTTGIERVVFLGDSVTVGTPPTTADSTYRAQLAEMLAARFGLRAPSSLWQRFDVFEGTALVEHSGDFWSCARWGARNHDLLSDERQIEACFPPSERNKKTLVIMTMGGNDIAHFTKMGLEGAPLDHIAAYVDGAAADLEAAVRHLKDTTEFPAGNVVVFANPPEFTDGTGDVGSCPAASVGGYDGNWEDPVAQARLVVRLLEAYMRVAVETRSDIVFFLESFCGHGYRHDDPEAACYRGPDAERWFDLTCTHPNPVGHGELARLFFAVIDE